ncbi:MAG: 4Fe-4S dicluster domain-containing protein [Planctomycetota bacterium]
MSWITQVARVARRLLPDPPQQRPDGGVSRREFIRGGFITSLFRETAPGNRSTASADYRPAMQNAFPVLRPPGAVPEAQFLAGCTRCGDCIRACPHQAIVLAPERLRAAAGTPIIDPNNQPCLMCVDTPCITACVPKVLRRAENAPVPVIGVAKISTLDCLAHQGTTCTTCSERCPVEGAITLTNQRPQVVADRCTGCGICHHVCPAPRNAVLVMPTTRN